MFARITILLAVVVLALSPCATAQPACLPFWTDASFSIERSGNPETIAVRTRALIDGNAPGLPVVGRTGNQFTIVYPMNPLGVGDLSPWNDAVPLGTLPPGNYTVTVRFDTLGGGSVCTIGTTTFLIASPVPVLDPPMLAVLALTLAVLGCGLLVVRARGV